MGLGTRLHRFVTSLSEAFGPTTDPEFVCLKCGEGQDHEYHTCPDCGCDFVVPTDPEKSDR